MSKTTPKLHKYHTNIQLDSLTKDNFAKLAAEVGGARNAKTLKIKELKMTGFRRQIIKGDIGKQFKGEHQLAFMIR